MRLPINGTELYFDVDGAELVAEGPTLRERPTFLLLHGGPGFDHTNFKPHLAGLAEIGQIIYLDQRGQGRSGRPAIETCSPGQMADDAATICRALGIAQPVVVGHSYGGFVALYMAIRHPQVVGKLVLLNTAGSAADMSGGLEMLQRQHGQALFDGHELFPHCPHVSSGKQFHPFLHAGGIGLRKNLWKNRAGRGLRGILGWRFRRFDWPWC